MDRSFKRSSGRPGPGSQSVDLTFWLGPAGRGQSRLAVALAIVHSPEGISQEIKQDYLNVLGRTADPAGLNQWVSMIQNRQLTESQVVAAFLGSPEFFTRVLKAAKLI